MEVALKDKERVELLEAFEENAVPFLLRLGAEPGDVHIIGARGAGAFAAGVHVVVGRHRFRVDRVFPRLGPIGIDHQQVRLNVLE